MYNCEISRQHKAAIVIAIDQSKSMADEIIFNEISMSKARFVASVVGELIEELILCSRYDNACRDYYDIAVIGYSSTSVRPLLGRRLGFVPIAELACRDVEREFVNFRCSLLSGDVVLVPHGFPRWVSPVASGATPMYGMMLRVANMLERWCANPRHRACFPPIFINISDGMPSDGSEEQLLDVAERIKRISTDDGNAIMMNIKISSRIDTSSFIFPNMDDLDYTNSHALLLARLSSTIPQSMERFVRSHGERTSKPPYLALGYNVSPLEFVSMLNIGSRSDSANEELCLADMAAM